MNAQLNTLSNVLRERASDHIDLLKIEIDRRLHHGATEDTEWLKFNAARSASLSICKTWIGS